MTGCGSDAPAAWLAGLVAAACPSGTALSVSLADAAGCPGLAPQTLSLLWSAGESKWVSQENFSHAAGSGAVKFWVADGLPRMTLGAAEGTPMGPGEGGAFLFAFGGAACGASGCDAHFALAVSCDCCEVDGWGGEGWYRVADEGGDCESGPTVVVSLAEADRCDQELVICCGPYETEAEALAACAPLEPGSSCAVGGLFVLNQTVSGVLGAHPDTDYYRLSGGLTPGATYHITHTTTSLSSGIGVVAYGPDCSGLPISVAYEFLSGATADVCGEFALPEGADCLCVYAKTNLGFTGSYTFTIEAGPCPGGFDFLVMVNVLDLSGLDSTMNFAVNGVTVYTAVVTDPMTGSLGSTRWVGRYDPTVSEHAGFLDSGVNTDLGVNGPVWPGVDEYGSVADTLVTQGLNSLRTWVTHGGVGFTNGTGSVTVVRVAHDGTDWEYDGSPPTESVLSDHAFTNKGGGFDVTVYFMGDGTITLVTPELYNFAFAQVDSADFEISWDDWSWQFWPRLWMRVEFSWDGVNYYEYWTYNDYDPFSEQFNNYDPTLSPPTYDPVPFTPGDTYYMRARFQDAASAPTLVSNWYVRSFVAT